MSEPPTRILLVEDDPAHADLIRNAFQADTVAVELKVARSLSQARAMLDQSSFDLLITDLLLPDGRGTALLGPDAETQTHPLVVITSGGDEQAAVAAIKAGAMDYVVKSAERLANMPHVVRRTLREWGHLTERKRAEEALRRAHDELEHRVAERTTELTAVNAALKTEIAERRQVEEALVKSEIRLRKLFENLPDFVIVVDRSATIQMANRPTDGTTPEELAGTTGFNHILPEFQPLCRSALKRVFTTGEVQSLRISTIYGAWWDCRLVPLFDEGTASTAMIICTDIGEQKKAQEAVEQERRLLRQLLDLHERERQLMAYEIHDGFAQQITGALFQLQGFHKQQQRDPQQAEATFQRVLKVLEDSVDETRRLISGLRPPILDEAGIVAAIDYLVCEASERDGLDIEFVQRVSFDRLDPPLETTVFRIVQESLTNIRRHSQCKRARISLIGGEGRLQIVAEDWGVGFLPDEVDQSHFGLKGIRERARLFGGKATIDSTPGQGTRITVELPLLENRPSPDESLIS